MSRDRYERRHRRTASSIESVVTMATADFDAVPSLAEAMGLHADSQCIPSLGDRGKTTRRKSTCTVRGPEGAWIAEQKEQAAKDRTPEPPLPLGIVATAYLVTCEHPEGLYVTEYYVNAWWFAADQLDAARRLALSLPRGRLQRRDTIRYVPPGKRKPRERTVWMEVE